MCKIALISYPIKSNSPFNFYINLGEIYDDSMKQNLSLLSQFYRELKFLYPFRYSKTCSNIEDYKLFRVRYKLTNIIKLTGQIPEEKIITFRTPILYDITCMVPLFINEPLKSPIKEYIENHIACIVLPSIDPIIRGKMLDEVITNKPKYIVLVGDKNGNNFDSTSTLMHRYLRKYSVPNLNIIKSNVTSKIPNCILDCLSILEIIDIDIINKYKIIVACSPDDITFIQKSVRSLRSKGIIKQEISYYCVTY